MKWEPASPDQRVPSQSNTATLGLRARTWSWNSGVVRRAIPAGRDLLLSLPLLLLLPLFVSRRHPERSEGPL